MNDKEGSFTAAVVEKDLMNRFERLRSMKIGPPFAVVGGDVFDTVATFAVYAVRAGAVKARTLRDVATLRNAVNVLFAPMMLPKGIAGDKVIIPAVVDRLSSISNVVPAAPEIEAYFFADFILASTGKDVTMAKEIRESFVASTAEGVFDLIDNKKVVYDCVRVVSPLLFVANATLVEEKYINGKAIDIGKFYRIFAREVYPTLAVVVHRTKEGEKNGSKKGVLFN